MLSKGSSNSMDDLTFGKASHQPEVYTTFVCLLSPIANEHLNIYNNVYE